MGNLFSSPVQPVQPVQPSPPKIDPQVQPAPYSPSGNNPYSQGESDECKKFINNWQTKQGNTAPKWMNDGSYCYVIPAGQGAGYKTMDECVKGQPQCDPNGDCNNFIGISSACSVKLPAESYEQPCCRSGPYVGLSKTWREQKKYTL